MVNCFREQFSYDNCKPLYAGNPKRRDTFFITLLCFVHLNVIMCEQYFYNFSVTLAPRHSTLVMPCLHAINSGADPR